jgi:hypothetical protein
MRLVWTLLFGAIVTLLFGAVVVHERGYLTTRRLPARRLNGGRARRLLTVEEAARWRPE